MGLLVAALAFFSLCVASVRLGGQRDLKRMVAFMTIIETNWLVFCFSLGSPAMASVGFFLTAVHAFTTALGFLFVEVLSRQFQTRD